MEKSIIDKNIETIEKEQKRIQKKMKKVGSGYLPNSLKNILFKKYLRYSFYLDGVLLGLALNNRELIFESFDDKD